MRTDYFDDLIGPGCPGSKNTTGATANPRGDDVAPAAPAGNGEAEKSVRVLHTHYGAGHPDAKPAEPMPKPAVAWPQDLDGLLRRVSALYEWTQADRADFTAWARRSPDGMADARAFLEAEAAKLPVPGPTDRRRVALGR